ncbi:MAG: sigma-70 family RNA polymerase sigma factor [Caldilineaceae bacterium]|nr:sigma-70 family RNA polymerase sigma factor [Caldilineaceae bacterium]
MNQLAGVVAAAQQGDKQAFDQLVIRFQDMAYASAYAIVGDPHLAQDAAQEAFLDAYQNLAQLREPAAFPGWFRRIVLGRSQRQIRIKAPAHLPLDDLPELDAGLYAGLCDPAEMLQQREDAQVVQEAVAALSPNLRMVTALYYIEGYSQKEIAAYLDTPVSTVKKRLFDARQRLKERMILMVQEQLQANKPSQNDDFARKVHFFTALLAGDTAQMEDFLRQDPSLLSAKVEWKMALRSGYWPLGSTALHLAVGRGDRAEVELLLARGAAVDARNVGEMTSLHLAAIMQRPEMARLLLQHGAAVDARSKAEQTPLHLAALRSDQATMQVLVDHKADVAAVDREGHTPAELAALRHDTKTVEFLVAHGAAEPTVAAQSARWPRITSDSPLLVTGVKAIDLLTPLPRGGIAGHFTPLAGVGFSVLLAQYISSVGKLYDGYAIYLGLETFNGYSESLPLSWQETGGVNDRVTYLFGAIEDSDAKRMKLLEQGLAAAKEYRQAGHETLLVMDSNLACTPGVMPYLRANSSATSPAAITTIVHGHHTVGVLPDALADLTTVITFNGALARQRLYPAIDPARSYSRLFEQQLAGSAHAKTAAEVRRLLQRYMDIHPVVESGGVEALWYIDDDPQVQQTIVRARRLQRFLTQPFYGAEPWTGMIGQLVPLEETLRGCQAILNGDYDTLPEEAFSYSGSIDEAVAKASVSA